MKTKPTTYTLVFAKDDKRVAVSYPLLGSFLLGPVWLLISMALMPALIYFLICLATGGLAWVVLPFFTPALCRRWYESQGWTEERPVTSGEPAAQRRSARHQRKLDEAVKKMGW